MKPHALTPRFFEFNLPDLDTLVLVEVADEAVIIRATRPTFSDARKRCFIRHLAAEGFIPDEYLWFPMAGPVSERGVRWVVDISWLKLGAAQIAHTRRCMLRMLGGAGLLWLGMIAAVLLRGTS